MNLLRAILTPYARLLLWIERISMAVAGVCFAAIAVITGVDVAMRYVFNAPLVWSYELISDYLILALPFEATQKLLPHLPAEEGTEKLARQLERHEH